MFKIAFSILFLFIFGFYSFGNILLFNFIRQEIRSEINKLIRKSDGLKFEILVISKIDMMNPAIFKFEERDEFIYHNKFYDVVSSYTKGDSVVYSCINDEKEEKLFRHFISESIDDLMDGNFNDRLPKLNSLKLIFLDDIIQIALNFISEFKIQNYFDFVKALNFYYSNTPSPPPKIIF